MSVSQTNPIPGKCGRANAPVGPVCAGGRPGMLRKRCKSECAVGGIGLSAESARRRSRSMPVNARKTERARNACGLKRNMRKAHAACTLRGKRLLREREAERACARRFFFRLSASAKKYFARRARGRDFFALFFAKRKCCKTRSARVAFAGEFGLAIYFLRAIMLCRINLS